MNTPSTPPASAALTGRALAFHRRGKAILDGIDCAVFPGEVLGILGANGAGKSTLLALLAGDEIPASGEIALNGVALARLDQMARARQRAVLPQQATLAFALPVRDVVAMGAYPFPELSPAGLDVLVSQALHDAGIAHLAARAYPELSGGEQQRVQFARVLVQVRAGRQPGEARYLLLDEPTASLDPRFQHSLLQVASLLAEREHTGVIVVLHDVNLAARWCHRIALLAQGRLVASGPPADVLQGAALEQTYQLSCTVMPHPQQPSRPLVLFA
ncbi:heme ABC transporter ATP-binding protein [Chitinilyticum aquatile]|uniref:heme ABC transporter ATP-binding protein n=1 Tax=Chitinilyticum aquatile TaxID=362520 RepID=UPI00041871F2|nr:heme ABC transporter ATP-binding protein [Chitinilyticum aquatile]